ncbi:MAG: hypothetical protein HY913_04135 [Desulfomonile tiedjei]|nr:hypothetical protein [Desulfomonile tiedjei]
MRVLSTILIVVLFGPWIFFHEAWAEPADVTGGQPQDAEAAKYWESVERKRIRNRCLKLGKQECYKKYQDAVDWCLKNWNECLPMIRHTGVYAGAYGEQVAEQCKRELEEKCRIEAGQ